MWAEDAWLAASEFHVTGVCMCVNAEIPSWGGVEAEDLLPVEIVETSRRIRKPRPDLQQISSHGWAVGFQPRARCGAWNRAAC
jgi:hypothetical protein